MKHTCKSRLATGLARILALCMAFAGIQSFAQIFDTGTPTTITSSTNYDDTMYVGFEHANNEVSIESNATVSANQVIIGQLSTNNILSVVGGSRLIAGNATTNGMSTGGVVVGDGDGEAALRINHSSTLNTEYLYVGDSTNHSGQVELSGNGSEINVAQNAVVGSTGSDNSINVGDGSSLKVGNNLLIGSNTGSNNLITVATGGSLFVNNTNNIDVTNSAEGNGISVHANGTLQVGGGVNTGTLGDLGVDMSANANLEVGGTLTLNNSKINNSLNVILNNNLSTNTASWTSSAITTIGSTTSGNSLTFTNGATGLAQNFVQLGGQTASQGNELNVGGAGSLFTADTNVYLGANGGGNRINIGNEGQMDIGGALYLGYAESSTGNAVNISSNGVLNVGGNIIVGNNSNNNDLTIEDGAVDVGKNFIMGNTASADGITYSYADTANRATVGTNTTMDIHQDLTVGMGGNGNTFSIRDGGVVTVDGDAIIGKESDDNYIFLMPDNTDTTFNVAGDLVVGVDGGDNRFSIYGGTANIEGNLYLGASTNQHDQVNYIHLATTNAVLNVDNTINIGASNSDNLVRVARGATINTKDLFVGTHEGVSNNTVTISGEQYNNNTDTWAGYIADSHVNITNALVIGNTNGANNTVVVRDGGILNVEQSGIDIAGTNNTLKIATGGTLKTGDWDFSLLTGSATNILLESGSTLHMLGDLTGTNMVEDGLNFVLDGTNSSWNTSTNDLYVGYETGANALTITNGAQAHTASNLYLGYTSSSLENLLTVAGTGSVLAVGYDLQIGTATNSSGNNTLAVIDGATMVVTNNANLFRGGILKIGSTSKASVLGDYSQDEYSTLEIGISSNQVQPNLVVGGTAAFANSANTTKYPMIRIYDEGIAESNVITIVQAGNITVDGQEATAENIAANIGTNLLLGFTVSVSNDVANTYIVLDDFITHSWNEYLSGQSLDVITEIGSLSNSTAISMLKVLADKDPTTAAKIADNYYGEKMSSTPVNNAINLGIQSMAAQLTKRADSTRARMGMAASDSQPAGASGPHTAEQELQGWMTVYQTSTDKKAADGFDAYDGTINGFLIGADLSVAEGILVGAAGGSGHATLDKNNGASTDAKTIFGSIYASAGTKDWFADASLLLGGSSIDSSLGSTFDTAASYDAQNIAIYFGGGKEIIGNYLIVTPQASLLGNYYSQDGYTETSSNAVGRVVDSFDTLYIQSSIGCNVALYTAMGDTVLKPELRAFWLHEFNAREEDVSFQLSNGTGGSYTMQLQAPEADIINLGTGISAKIGEYLELRADLDIRMGSDYSDHTLLGSLRYQF